MPKIPTTPGLQRKESCMAHTRFHLPDALQVRFCSHQTVENCERAERCKCCDETSQDRGALIGPKNFANSRMSAEGVFTSIPGAQNLGVRHCPSLFWRAASAETTALPSLVIFSLIWLLTVNPFHLKGTMLQASNDNLIELAARMGTMLSAPSQLHELASKLAMAQHQQDAGHTPYPSQCTDCGPSFQHPAGLERACEGYSPILSPVAWSEIPPCRAFKAA
jgi:hypothetical protein